MATAETILVVFLSAALLLFLILGIVMVSIGIAILRNVKHISQKASDASDNVGDIIKMVGTKIAPVAMSAAVAAAMRRFTKRKGD